MSIHPYDFIFAGLSLDVVGALVLAKSFMFKNPQDAYYEGLPVHGGNNLLLKSALLQRGEARAGAALLMAGFLLQMWGNLHGGIAANEPGWIRSTPRILLAVAVAAAVGALLVGIATHQARVQFYRIYFRNYSGQTKLHPTQGDSTWFDRTARFLDLRRRTGEGDEEFLPRLERRRVELGKRHGGKLKDFIVDG